MSQEHVRILREARKLIESRKVPYICWAVEKAARGRAEGDEIRAVIAQRLSPNGTISCWLEVNGHASWDELLTQRTRLRTTRLAWIDSLIEEFGGKP